jgi:hypothetical protein
VRILLDESLPRGLKRLLQGLDVITVPERGWQGIRNGDLLRLASEEFQVFVTADQSLEHQQNLKALPIAVVVLAAVSNRLEAYESMVPRIREAIETSRPGSFAKIDDRGRPS